MPLTFQAHRHLAPYIRTPSRIARKNQYDLSQDTEEWVQIGACSESAECEQARPEVNAGVEPIFNSITFMSCYSLTRIMLSLSIIQASLILLSLNRIIRNVQRSLPLRIVFSIRTSNWLSGSSCDKIYRMLCREHSHCCGWFLSPHLTLGHVHSR